MSTLRIVVPAKARIQFHILPQTRLWIPAFAGMTGVAL